MHVQSWVEIEQFGGMISRLHLRTLTSHAATACQRCSAHGTGFLDKQPPAPQPTWDNPEKNDKQWEGCVWSNMKTTTQEVLESTEHHSLSVLAEISFRLRKQQETDMRLHIFPAISRLHTYAQYVSNRKLRYLESEISRQYTQSWDYTLCHIIWTLHTMFVQSGGWHADFENEHCVATLQMAQVPWLHVTYTLQMMFYHTC